MTAAPASIARHERRERLRLTVSGAVQGVGFRPFVHRLAVSEGLGGFVLNTAEGAAIEIEGPAPALRRFLARLDGELKPPAAILARRSARLAPTGEADFVIAGSRMEGGRPATVLPDLAICPDCLAEIGDAADRRYRYPFTTCTRCGPRYSIVEALPYDRCRTVMRHFPMCEACQAEYHDPASRRFHAETNACPDCGPSLALRDADAALLFTNDAALAAAAEALTAGRIVALKGLGGFQLLCDARNETAVRRLRAAKARPAKPFAVMAASLAGARALADIGAEEERLLASAVAPIVLLRARYGNGLAPGVAPGSPLVGLMLPTTPLHHLLLAETGLCLVATSGNRGSEPIVYDEAGMDRLAGLADLFLVHDRPILRGIDDSVTRVIAGAPVTLRLARGLAPLALEGVDCAPGLALGGHQKDAVAQSGGGRIVLGPHIGDLDSVASRDALDRDIADLATLYRLEPRLVACDAHPDYHTTRLAERLGPPVVRVRHHLAHVLAGMLDNGLAGPVLGVAWDGAGHGGDGTAWGGEILLVEGGRWRRFAHLLPFPLPGGDRAAREPRRSALGALYAAFGTAAFDRNDLPPVAGFTPAEIAVLRTMLERGVNAPLTSSAGRLFDAVAALLGLCQRASFEGEAAMALEYAADRADEAAPLAPVTLEARGGPVVLDWRPMLASLLDRMREGVPAEALAAGFHRGLADAILAVARRAGAAGVLLTGGCFQNARLAEETTARLEGAGFSVYRHRRIPPGDGGLAAGQAFFTARPLVEEKA